ncbi:hypothetical protein RvY_10184 [Ramazzottius varieornatus]|uniref:Uncharacterized protein n=1 Tax=Ramazzottius varieornatus TaxID=947166 RepID=A0A1D1VGF6_RAMVA|nr:hypothetical protein RvY_10184 [Ramazzottius varieornatus]
MEVEEQARDWSSIISDSLSQSFANNITEQGILDSLSAFYAKNPNAIKPPSRILRHPRFSIRARSFGRRQPHHGLSNNGERDKDYGSVDTARVHKGVKRKATQICVILN